MTRLFRTTRPAFADWLGLSLFALIYLAAMGAVIAPHVLAPDAPRDIVLKE
jgi:hypothetical protein